jgi:flagellar hook-associated protein 3 FlgL
MGTMRVTQAMLVTRALNDLNFQTRRLMQLQEQLATGLKVNAPSDDPLAARRAVNLRTIIGRDEQYLSNISTAGPQLLESTTALQTVVSAIQRARELTLQGASGTTSQAQMNQIAMEVNQLLEAVLEQANHQTNSRYIFGGTRTLNVPFVATRDAQNQITAVTYQGNDEAIKIPVADGITVTINEPGSHAFQSSQNVFQMLIDIRDNLVAGDKTSLQNQRLVELGTTQNQVLVSMTSLGATQNRLDRLTANTDEYIQQLRAALSDAIDADYAETVLNLDAQTNAFRSALNAAARVIQPSLLDFVQ